MNASQKWTPVKQETGLYRWFESKKDMNREAHAMNGNTKITPNQGSKRMRRLVESDPEIWLEELMNDFTEAQII